MKRSLYSRNFISMAGVVFVSFLLLGAAFSAAIRGIVMNERRTSMEATADEVVRSVTSVASEWELDSFDMKLILSINSNASGYQIMLTDVRGQVICCSDMDVFCDHYGKTVDDRTMELIYADGGFRGMTELGGVYPTQKYVVARLFGVGNRALGCVFLSGDTDVMYRSWRQFAGRFLLIAVFVLIITSVVSLIMTKKQTDPLKQMADAADKFARGEFDARVSDGGREDEIGQLANAFNAMADALQNSENRRREFIANVSHELKTPMTTISGFADGILDGTIPHEEQGRYLSTISSETKRLSRLVRSMLDMSQLQSTDPAALAGKSFDICDVVVTTLLGLESRITDRGLDVDAELPEESVTVRGDRDSITQVVYNLIDNAAKFASDGSRLGISVWKQGARAYVSVENTGAEIPEDELPFIFDRFHKADHSRSADKDGVGLGLYIVKTILDNHGEDIYVTSENGVTKFVFTMTVVDPKR